MNGTDGKFVEQIVEKFIEYCEDKLELTQSVEYGYQSLSVCILDCVYSLRARYFNVTVPLIKRYADVYMNGDPHRAGDTVAMLLERMEEIGGPEAFANNILRNHQKLGGRKQIPKEQVCYQLAKYLKYLQIDTMEDFQAFESQELLETVIRSVNGMGDAGANYLFMLAGDQNRCKPDVHIRRCVKDACGLDFDDEKYQVLFAAAVEKLRHTYPLLTVRKLDGIIWNCYQSRDNK